MVMRTSSSTSTRVLRLTCNSFFISPLRSMNETPTSGPQSSYRWPSLLMKQVSLRQILVQGEYVSAGELTSSAAAGTARSKVTITMTAQRIIGTRDSFLRRYEPQDFVHNGPLLDGDDNSRDPAKRPERVGALSKLISPDRRPLSFPAS